MKWCDAHGAALLRADQRDEIRWSEVKDVKCGDVGDVVVHDPSWSRSLDVSSNFSIVRRIAECIWEVELHGIM